jgi:hypothetical protein
VTDKHIAYITIAACLAGVGWTLRQWWRASRRPYVYRHRGRVKD